MSESEYNIYRNEFVDNYISDLGSRIVSETGISSDKYHIGKIILRNLKEDPDFVMQINGGTGESETNGSALRRTVQCAASMKTMGLKTGDVMILMAPNHLDLAIPLYAALCLGVAVATIDYKFKVYELKYNFGMNKPKIIFCQSDKVPDVQKALQLLEHDAAVISFDKSEHTLNFHDMLEKSADVKVDEFKATDFNAEETLALLIHTSGSTGLPKAAAFMHKSCIITGTIIRTFGKDYSDPYRSVFLTASSQWISALIHFVFSPYFKYTRIQTPHPVNPKLAFDIIKKFKPEFLFMSTPMLMSWANIIDEEKCDFSCFKVISVGGSAVPNAPAQKIMSISPNAEFSIAYGMSELGGRAFHSVGCPPGSVGKRLRHYLYKLVDHKTDEEIKEPNKCGELWLKGDMFKCYYNNPEATSEAFTKDNWFKTGDIMYRDEHWNYYYVDRIKSIFEYNNYPVSPVELENVIREHPSVADVVVTGVPDPEYGHLPAACVVLRPDHDVTAQEIKDLVKEKLTDPKHLRGGVYFMKELPLTATTKVHRQKIKEIVLELARKLVTN